MELAPLNKKRAQRKKFEDYSIPPHNREAEEAVLGACLLEPSAFFKISGLLETEFFYFENHREVYKTLMQLSDDNIPIDIIQVMVAMEARGIKEIDGLKSAVFLTKLTNSVVSTAHIVQHALAVREMMLARLLIQIKYERSEDDTLAEANSIIEKLNSLIQIKSASKMETFAKAYDKVDAQIEVAKQSGGMVGIRTGFNQLDEAMGGFRNGEFIIIAARPGVGKSMFMNNCIITAAMDGYYGMVFSLEMQKHEILIRMASTISAIPHQIISNGQMNEEEESKYLRARDIVKNFSFSIDDSAYLRLRDLRAQCTFLKAKGQLDILFVDYLQLVAPNSPTSLREQAVAEISKGLKILAKDLQIPVVALAQIGRGGESNADKKPRLSNLRESGSLEQDADMVMLIHRDWNAGILADPDGNTTQYEADLSIAKGRNTGTAEFKLGFEGRFARFIDMDEDKRLIYPIYMQDEQEQPQQETQKIDENPF